MRLRNGDHGYGVVTKSLHWLTVLAIGSQFAVGYTMDTDGGPEAECDPPGEGDELTDAEEERLDRIEDRCEAEQDRLGAEAEDAVGTAWSDLGSADLLDGGLSLPEVHVLLGMVIIVLGILRLAWRRTTPLPPWDPRLSSADQRLVHLTETALLTLQLVVPATGILLVAGSDDLLGLHLAAHIAFFVALAAHLGMVLGKRLVPRMLPWGRLPSGPR
jgi:cytochrome b561